MTYTATLERRTGLYARAAAALDAEHADTEHARAVRKRLAGALVHGTVPRLADVEYLEYLVRNEPARDSGRNRPALDFGVFRRLARAHAEADAVTLAELLRRATARYTTS